MSTPQRATPSDWAWLEGNSTVDRCDAAWSRGLVELRARVEALECKAAMDKLRAASAEVRPAPASSLVERVAIAMGPSSQAAMDAGELPYGSARAAIREVAAWLRDRADHWSWVAQVLEREAGR